MKIEKLISGAIDNDVKSQEKLYQLTYHHLFNVPMRYASHKSEAIEIFNIGMLSIFNSLKRFHIEKDYFPWASRILIHKSIDFVRSKNLYTKNIFPIIDENEMHHLEHENLSELEDEFLIKALHSLPDQERLVFSLYVIDEYSHDEISTEIQISSTYSRWLLYSAKKKLKNIITNSGKEYKIMIKNESI